jgi:oxygen-independent coproporphyrinogen-3 oxidase
VKEPDVAITEDRTEVGNYFVANYPPFSFWRPEQLQEVWNVLRKPPTSPVPLGLYLHIPFCRKRCKFCYYRVYTDKRAVEVERYLAALAREVEQYAVMPAIRERPVQFVYFGGGTPSYLSIRQLEALVDRLREAMSWEAIEEVTFECEPGTLTEGKVRALRAMGVTRLSLGVENFHDEILAENGRAHLSTEIYRSWEWIQKASFPQTNIDLIAGMVGETWENWRLCVRKAIELNPDSITVYQMELPYNTVYSHMILKEGRPVPVASWALKREWVRYAFEEFQNAGYQVSSAYTVVKNLDRVKFLYRDALWQGADLIGAGVSSFGHLQGVHVQNRDRWEDYLEAVEAGQFPFSRALRPTLRQLMIREFILQLKLGRVSRGRFRAKFQMDPGEEFRDELAELASQGFVVVIEDEIRVTLEGLLRVDTLLRSFFEPAHRTGRYT